MKISIVAAMTNGRVLGKDGELPWGRLPEDMKHFRELTIGKPVIMGRKTFESIGHPLEKRVNIVLTSKKPRLIGNTSLTMYPVKEGLLFSSSIQKALNMASFIKEEEVMVIGGASVYEQFLPLADKIYLTLISAEFEGDAFFPRYDSAEWRVNTIRTRFANAANPYHLSFVDIVRESS